MHKPRQATSRCTPKVDWRKLPPPVLECILSQLRTIHLEPQSRSCDTCHMRDVTSLQLSCRAWSARAQTDLSVSIPVHSYQADIDRYSKIAIIGADTPSKLKRFKVKTGVRLVLLRRTLRARPLLASLVKTLKVPDPMFPIYLYDGRPNPEYDDYLCLLASVVMCCPELEIFTGFNSLYNHTFDRLTHALSTRSKLKHHVWVMAENVEVMARCKRKLPSGLLDEHQVYQFLQYHMRWSKLETLMLCSPASLGVVEHGLFVDILRNLPSLRNLCVSSFDADDFNDATLLELPRIRSLRVEECEGVSDAGLAKWAACPTSVSVEILTLIHQNLTSLATISRLFSGLGLLKKFTIVQSDVSPSLPFDMVVCQPLFASKTVERIHWDIGEDASAGTSQLNLELSIRDIKDYERATPDIRLAQSILHNGFPALKSLRAPRDTSPSGALQSVCRPAKNANILLPTDSYSTHRLYAPRQSNSLQAARIRAQNLVEESMKSSAEHMKILVTDHTPDEQSTSTRPSTGTGTGSSGSSGLSTWTASTAATETDTNTNTTPLSVRDVIRLAKEKRDKSLLPSHLGAIVDSDENAPRQLTQLPPSYKLTSPPLKIHEFILPRFMGRVSTHITKGRISQPPLFDLIPDVVGRDANGGIASWGELLRIKERVGMAESEGRGRSGLETGVWGCGIGGELGMVVTVVVVVLGVEESGKRAGVEEGLEGGRELEAYGEGEGEVVDGS